MVNVYIIAIRIVWYLAKHISTWLHSLLVADQYDKWEGSPRPKVGFFVLELIGLEVRLDLELPTAAWLLCLDVPVDWVQKPSQGTAKRMDS